jgi:HEAT repeat protein
VEKNMKCLPREWRRTLCVLSLACLLAVPLTAFAQTPPDQPAKPSEKIEPVDMDKECEALVKKLVDDDPAVQLEARDEMLELGGQAVPMLVKGIEGQLLVPDTQKNALKYIACDLLGDIRSGLAVPTLLKLVESKDRYNNIPLAALAIRALGKIGNKSVTPNLIACLKDADPDIKYEAVRALGVMRTTEAADQLLSLVFDDSQTTEQRLVQCAAIEALGRLHARKAVPSIAGMLVRGNRTENDTGRKVSFYAIRALERITGENLGSVTMSSEKTSETEKKWSEWWEKNRETYMPKPVEPQKPPEKKPEEQPKPADQPGGTQPPPK